MRSVMALGLTASILVLFAFGGSASATTATSSGGTYTGTIAAFQRASFIITGVVDVTCDYSELEGSIVTHGAGVTAAAALSAVDFSKCNQHVETTLAGPGTLVFHSTATTDQTTVTSSGMTIGFVITTIFGSFKCSYFTNNSDLGTLFGGKPSIFVIHSASIPAEASSDPLCGSSVQLHGGYEFYIPSGLTFD